MARSTRCGDLIRTPARRSARRAPAAGAAPVRPRAAAARRARARSARSARRRFAEPVRALLADADVPRGRRGRPARRRRPRPTAARTPATSPPRIIPHPGGAAARAHRAAAHPGRHRAGRRRARSRRAADAAALEGSVRSVGQGAARGRHREPARAAPRTRPRPRSLVGAGSSCPARSAYVDGQVVRVGAPVGPARTPDPSSAARRAGRRRHRRGPRHRRGDRRRPGPRRRDRRRRRRAGRGGGARGVANAIGGTALQLDITAADAAERHRSSTLRAAARARSTSSCTTPASPATSCWPTWTPSRWDAVHGGQPRAPSSRSTRRCSPTGLLRPTGRASSASPRSAASPATAARPTTRPARRASSAWSGRSRRGSPRAAATVNAVAPGFIETEMTATMPLGHPGGRPTDQQPAAGRAAGGRRRDHRLARPGRERRRDRPGRAGLRPEPAGGLMRRTRCTRRPPARRRMRRRGPSDAARHRRRPRGRRRRPRAPRRLRRGVRLRRSTTRCRRPTRTCWRFPLQVRADGRPGVPAGAARAGARPQRDQRAPPDRRRRALDVRVRAERLARTPRARRSTSSPRWTLAASASGAGAAPTSPGAPTRPRRATVADRDRPPAPPTARRRPSGG